ncbi:MAG: mannose-1-phosphate guanylyltransferase/mannose-6-phosphate isomerase [Betaproteobacteria bacterium]|nr:mannose-1-phosphate guanylyltransferase/mannose-6-phosphate isomerase [Betaproteobacteria bacterium]
MNSDPLHIKPVILCGGSGTRLWPMSRKLLPKQFLPLVSSGSSLLQDTAKRASRVSGVSDAIVVCNEEHRFLVAEQLAAVGTKALQLLEPAGRNTAAAVAAVAIATEAQNPVLLVLASDHAISDLEKFSDAVRRAAQLAAAGYLVTFGIHPARPETGFGYIERGEPIAAVANAYRISRFVEKPGTTEAQALIDTGRAFWNSGMFAFTSARLIEEMARYRPDILAAARAAVATAEYDLGFLRLGRDAFLSCPSEPLDRAVMERTDRAAVIPAEFGWSDVGSWTALWDIAEKDSNGNAKRGDVRLQDTRNSLVFSDRRLVATLGIDDLVIVETDDAVLISHRSRSQEVRDIVESMHGTGRTEHLSHTRVYRPWGYFENLDSGPGYLVKRIMVKPGAALSLQMHHHRAEHWVVVSGSARVTRGDKVTLLERNQSVYIPLGETHRLENPSAGESLHLIEVQSGDRISEDDIVRIEDVYKRS